ncbi:MAG: MarR family transcriptional regulator [Proteobacteria bacterium]|nr:MarR family transcriptional regulator [Pseudomonadota bacterium]MCH9049618.1 MarR family transcriptional regulator [Pseudomonadota bacterium]
MTINLTFDQALEVWRGAVLEVVRRDPADLSARQMAVVLTVYLSSPPHTVRGLARTLNVSKPAITRALDRLEKLEFVRRRRDESDRRSIFVQRTVKGSVYLRETADLITVAAQRHH